MMTILEQKIEQEKEKQRKLRLKIDSSTNKDERFSLQTTYDYNSFYLMGLEMAHVLTLRELA